MLPQVDPALSLNASALHTIAWPAILTVSFQLKWAWRICVLVDIVCIILVLQRKANHYLSKMQRKPCIWPKILIPCGHEVPGQLSPTKETTTYSQELFLYLAVSWGIASHYALLAGTFEPLCVPGRLGLLTQQRTTLNQKAKSQSFFRRTGAADNGKRCLGCSDLKVSISPVGRNVKSRPFDPLSRLEH